jgi:hypothetical protein
MNIHINNEGQEFKAVPFRGEDVTGRGTVCGGDKGG